MTAEAIARVVADLAAGRAVSPPIGDELGEWRDGLYTKVNGLFTKFGVGTVIDATAIYQDLVSRPRSVLIYEDHPCIAPPYDSLAICYENEHGNVIVVAGFASEWAEGEREELWESPDDHTIDWDRVRWTYDTFVYVGNRGQKGPMPTAGPLHCWRYAIYEDGSPADIRWVQIIPEHLYPMDKWDMAQCVQLGAITFLNAVNVRPVEPSRPRAERRRIERTGITVHTLAVFPSGKRAATGRANEGVGVPLSSVRGHMAHYGDCCPGAHPPRGLAFGRLTGKFWIPAHARGAAEHGAVVKDYELRA